MLSLDKRLHTVEEALRQRIEQFSDPTSLYQPIAYGLEKGGKRLRPVLLLMAVELYNKNITPAVPAALALEVFHNFTLLHDDIMDQSDQRRGKPSVPAKYGLNQALLSGDAMYAVANSILTEAPTDKLPALLRAFSRMNIEIMEGQQWDINFESLETIRLDSYLEMIRLKTAVLFATALQMGAIIAEAPADEIEALYRSGTNIGVAFQLRDDYLDVYGDSATFGKPIGGDIEENKKTWLYIMAQEIATERKDKAWKEALRLEGKDEKFQAVRKIYDEYDLPAKGEKLIEKYTKDALCELRHLRDINPEVLGVLEALYLKLAGRDA